MTKLQFEPDDFITFAKMHDDKLHIDHRTLNQRCADQANAKLAEIKAAWLLELKQSATVVYGLIGDRHVFISQQQEVHTHRAYLIGIEEINKELTQGDLYKSMIAAIEKIPTIDGRAEWLKNEIEKNIRGPTTEESRNIALNKKLKDIGLGVSLKPKECEHEPITISCAEEFGGMGQVKSGEFKPVCGKCGAKIKATWSVED